MVVPAHLLLEGDVLLEGQLGQLFLEGDVLLEGHLLLLLERDVLLEQKYISF